MLLKQWANEKKKMIHFYEKTKKNKTVLGQNSKEPSSSTISTEASINDDSNEETLNINQQLQKIDET